MVNTKIVLIIGFLFSLNNFSLSQCENGILDSVVFYINKNDTNEAFSLIDEYIECKESNKQIDFEAYYLRGYCKQMKNDLVGAIEDYDISLKYNNRYFNSYYERASCYFLLGQHPEALKDYYYAYQIKTNADVCFAMGYTYYELRQFDHSLKYLDEAIKYDDEFRTYSLRCKVKIMLGDIEGAKKDNSRCLEIDKNNLKTNENNVWISYVLGDNEKLCFNLRKLINSESGDLFDDTIEMYSAECQ